MAIILVRWARVARNVLDRFTSNGFWNKIKIWICGCLIFIYFCLFIFSLINYKARIKISYPFHMFEPNTENLCQLNSSNLGPFKLDMFYHPDMDVIINSNKQVLLGGRWKPADCKAWQKVAVIIPYRSRYEHLKQLLYRLHPMLQRQKIYYRIYVVEQDSDSKFNRGRLLNVGVLESLKHDDFDCFVFHDVDLLPEDDRNIYHCDSHAHHLISAVDEMRYHIMYYNYLGGALSINKVNLFKANGHSNSYWGWGNEDDDFNARTNEIGLSLTRPPQNIGRYKMIRHAKFWNENGGNDLFMTWKSRWMKDGLNVMNRSTYNIFGIVEHPLYTNISVDVGLSPDEVAVDPSAKKESLFWFLSYYFP